MREVCLARGGVPRWNCAGPEMQVLRRAATNRARRHAVLPRQVPPYVGLPPRKASARDGGLGSAPVAGPLSRVEIEAHLLSVESRCDPARLRGPALVQLLDGMRRAEMVDQRDGLWCLTTAFLCCSTFR